MKAYSSWAVFALLSAFALLPGIPYGPIRLAILIILFLTASILATQDRMVPLVQNLVLALTLLLLPIAQGAIIVSQAWFRFQFFAVLASYAFLIYLMVRLAIRLSGIGEKLPLALTTYTVLSITVAAFTIAIGTVAIRSFGASAAGDHMWFFLVGYFVFLALLLTSLHSNRKSMYVYKQYSSNIFGRQPEFGPGNCA